MLLVWQLLGNVIAVLVTKVIGINEYLIMNSISGMLHSVMGCQPLLVAALGSSMPLSCCRGVCCLVGGLKA